MNNSTHKLKLRIIAVLLTLSLLLTTSGCLPVLAYNLTLDSSEVASTSGRGQAQASEEVILSESGIEAEGIYNDLSYDELVALLFEEEVTWDSSLFNQLVSDPEAVGIEAPRPATHGDYSHEADLQGLQFYAEVLEALTGGHTIDLDELDETRARGAETIIDTLTGALEYETFFYYYEPLSPSTGAQANLPLSLMDYTFRVTEDIDIYLELLEDTPRYFEQLIALEWEKVDNGIMMARESMESSMEEAEAYIVNAEDHVLTTAFNEMLDKAIENAAEGSDLKLLSAEEIAAYKEKNFEAIELYIVPSYEYLLDEMENLLPFCNEGTSLSDYARGTEYYEMEMASMGFSESPTEAIATLEEALDGYLDVIYSGSTGMISGEVIEAIGDDPRDYISYIQEHSGNEFALVELDYQIKIAPEASPNDYAMAYFMFPPVDDPQINNIVYFPRNISDEVELFSTMAHEGYPGHMYQIYQYSQENPDHVNKLYGYLAYTEGWAMYSQSRAMYTLDAEVEEIDAYVAYEKFMYGLYARVDLGVNYEGWDVEQTKEYLDGWGFGAAAKDLYEVVIAQPVSYLAYGLGVIQFDQMRSEAEETLTTEFDPVEYHSFITSLGSVSFAVLEEEFAQWLESTI